MPVPQMRRRLRQCFAVPTWKPAYSYPIATLTLLKYSWAKWFHQTSTMGEFTAGLRIERKTMSKSLIDLISILDLEPIEVNLFRGNSPKTSWQRVFGGQVIGQAMVAACRTVEGRLPHSIHCYFILPGDPQIPIIYEVERLRDGRSYSTRRVTAIQHGNAIFSIMVSFHAEEKASFDHQDKMPDVPPGKAYGGRGGQAADVSRDAGFHP